MEQKLRQQSQPGLEEASGMETAAKNGSLVRIVRVERKLWKLREPGQELPSAERTLQQLRQPGHEVSGGGEIAAERGASSAGSKWKGNCNSYGCLVRRMLVERKLQQLRQPGKEDGGGVETATAMAALPAGF